MESERLFFNPSCNSNMLFLGNGDVSFRGTNIQWLILYVVSYWLNWSLKTIECWIFKLLIEWMMGLCLIVVVKEEDRWWALKRKPQRGDPFSAHTMTICSMRLIMMNNCRRRNAVSLLTRSIYNILFNMLVNDIASQVELVWLVWMGKFRNGGYYYIYYIMMCMVWKRIQFFKLNCIDLSYLTLMVVISFIFH